MARVITAGAVVATASIAGCGDDGSAPAWDPTEYGDGATATATGEPPADTDAPCDAGTVEPCLCPDGLSLGEMTCEPSGSFGPCECTTATDDGGSDESGGSMPPLPDEVCYLGADQANTTCLPLVAFYDALPEGYEYPAAMRADGNDRPPLALIDVQEASGSLAIAPNFVLDELAQPSVGRWAVIQPHAVASLQAMRDQAGPIAVVTGYLSPAANSAAGGAADSRALYGDGFDLDPIDTTFEVLADLCVGQGGAATILDTHVHCEFSAVPVDEAFFGPG